MPETFDFFEERPIYFQRPFLLLRLRSRPDVRARRVAVALCLGLSCLFSDAALADATGSLRGRVASHYDGQPLGGLIVAAWPIDEAGDSLPVQVSSDASGFYRFEELPPGTYVVTARSAGGDYLPGAYGKVSCQACEDVGTPVRVGPSEDVSRIDFFLSRGGGVSGTIRAQDGAAVRGWILLRHQETGESHSRRVEGDFEVLALPPGPYTAEVFPQRPFFLNSNFVPQMWPGLDCAAGCPFGEVFHVVEGFVLPGIDFTVSCSELRTPSWPT